MIKQQIKIPWSCIKSTLLAILTPFSRHSCRKDELGNILLYNVSPFRQTSAISLRLTHSLSHSLAHYVVSLQNLRNSASFTVNAFDSFQYQTFQTSYFSLMSD
jgi:hypothetical protein